MIANKIRVYTSLMSKKWHPKHTGKWKKFNKQIKELEELHGWAKAKEEELEAKKKNTVERPSSSAGVRFARSAQ